MEKNQEVIIELEHSLINEAYKNHYYEDQKNAVFNHIREEKIIDFKAFVDFIINFMNQIMGHYDNPEKLGHTRSDIRVDYEVKYIFEAKTYYQHVMFGSEHGGRIFDEVYPKSDKFLYVFHDERYSWTLVMYNDLLLTLIKKSDYNPEIIKYINESFHNIIMSYINKNKMPEEETVVFAMELFDYPLLLPYFKDDIDALLKCVLDYTPFKNDYPYSLYPDFLREAVNNKNYIYHYPDGGWVWEQRFMGYTSFNKKRPYVHMRYHMHMYGLPKYIVAKKLNQNGLLTEERLRQIEDSIIEACSTDSAYLFALNIPGADIKKIYNFIAKYDVPMASELISIINENNNQTQSYVEITSDEIDTLKNMTFDFITSHFSSEEMPILYLIVSENLSIKDISEKLSVSISKINDVYVKFKSVIDDFNNASGAKTKKLLPKE